MPTVSCRSFAGVGWSDVMVCACKNEETRIRDILSCCYQNLIDFEGVSSDEPKKIRAQVWSRWKMIHHFEKTKIDSRKCGMYLHSPPTTIYHAINSEQLPCSHSMTSPPPCFRVEVVCSGWCAPDKFQHTDSPTFPGLTCLDLCYALHIYRCWQRSVRYSKLKILIYRTAVHTGRLFIN